MAAENKVQFNLKNVHYAILTLNGDTPTYGTPVHVPGAVSLALEQSGNTTSFYADGIRYYTAQSNTGYNGDLEMARFPDQMMQDIWQHVLAETDLVAVENCEINPADFALLFQIDGDKQSRDVVMYNCSGTRPAVAGETTGENKEPKTQSSTITASALPNGNVMAYTTANTPDTIKNNWFKEVYVPDETTQAKIKAKIDGTETQAS